MTAVHQLLPVFAYGDAIGGATLRVQALLREFGYTSEIFAGLVDPRLKGQARDANDLLSAGVLKPDDVVVYRLSVGHPVTDVFELVPARKVLWFHNITPPEYYRPVNAAVAYWTQRGWDELRRIAPTVITCIADSAFNLSQALDAGAPGGTVVPIFDVDRLNPRPNRPTDPPTVLFVGRVAPNKRHEDLIRALAALRATSAPDARLAMLGSAHDCESYLEALMSLIDHLDLREAVHLPGKRCSDAEVADAYASAAVYASASEHEGFCVPILEAMAFEVPVVAYAAGAVPETAGGAAVLLDAKDPLIWAEALGRVINDSAVRDGLVAAGRLRLADFGRAVVGPRLVEALEAADIFVTNPAPVS